MQKVSLFPTCVGVFDLEGGFTTEEISYLNSLDLRNNTFNQTSVDSYIFRDPSMSRIVDFAQNGLDQYMEEVLCVPTTCGVKITQSWFNVTGQYESHHQHSHPNSYLSGVIYLECNEADQIKFCRPGSPEMVVESTEFNEFNSSTWWLPAISARMYVFRSNLPHYVEHRKSDGVRSSIAFNSFFTGVAGEHHDLTELRL